MAEIALLSQDTIDKIAAGEVIERPSSVVKELVENSIDAGATAVTVEIKDGGTSLIRITDNGCGIEKKQVSMAFLRHSTSKIKTVEDLLSVSSLGFRGEALSSIAAVAQVELITKIIPDLTGIRYVIEGSSEKSIEEIGAPDGTTFIIRNLFFNTPARRKFLKSPQTEAGYINTLMERLAMSRPDISFKFITNNQTKLHTSGNSNPKDVIYQIYGREITSSLVELQSREGIFQVEGFIGKPVISRGNRNFENYFINQRFIKSSLISKAIEDAYKNFLMQHQYPFCVLYFTFAGELLDVNVHPTKMELRFSCNEEIYQELCQKIRYALEHRDHIREVTVGEEKKEKQNILPEKREMPEPFEKKRMGKIAAAVRRDSPYEPKYEKTPDRPALNKKTQQILQPPLEPKQTSSADTYYGEKKIAYVQEELTYDAKFLSQQSKASHHIIGQVFSTYWLVEFEEKLFIIDQHAAHEKVLYERTMKSLHDKEFTSQRISPPIVLSLNAQEEEALVTYGEQLIRLGFETEHFGGREYAVCAVPGNLFGLDAKRILIELLDGTQDIAKNSTSEIVIEKIASMSCKAAVKGNQSLSKPEIEALLDELLELDNPYFCPHGRPTIISMSKYELEKKFKRII